MRRVPILRWVILFVRSFILRRVPILRWVILFVRSFILRRVPILRWVILFVRMSVLVRNSVTVGRGRMGLRSGSIVMWNSVAIMLLKVLWRRLIPL